jgi:membrane protein implicated in regulation of membrane protease activity
MLWWHWSILGLSLIGVEILTLGGLGNFYFLFFGVAALMVSGLTWAGLIEAAWLQWFLFAILGIISLLVMKKSLWNKKSMNGKDDPIVDSMVGEMATVIETLEPQALGKVELRGSTWNARNTGENILEKNTIAKIVRVEGLTLWVQAESLTQEESHVR